MELSDKEYLAHYGVLGMKWGRKRSVTTSTTSNGKISKKLNSMKQAHKANKVKNLSNKELQARIDRMRLEQNYKNLKKQSTVIGRGEQLVGNIAKGTVSRVAGDLAASAAKKAINDAMGRDMFR